MRSYSVLGDSATKAVASGKARPRLWRRTMPDCRHIDTMARELKLTDAP